MTARLQPLRGEGAKLWKMMKDADGIETLKQGMELAEAFAAPIENLLDGVEVNAGLLIRTSRFKGSLARQPILDLILLHQLSLAPAGSREANLRESVRHLELRTPMIPYIRGFTGLETLKLSLMPSLDAASLKELGSMPQLHELEVQAEKEGDQQSRLLALDGFEAPALVKAKLTDIGLTDISALAQSTQLEEIDLSKNARLQSINGLRSSNATLKNINLKGCTDLTDIEALANATELTQINLVDCASIDKLHALSASTKIEHLELDGCSALMSLEGITTPMITRSGWLGGQYSLIGCKNLKSLIGLPSLGEGYDVLELGDLPAVESLEGLQHSPQIKTLRIRNIGVSNIEHITCLESLQEICIDNASNLASVAVLAQSLKKLRLRDCSEISSIGDLPNGLNHLEIRNCPKIKSVTGVPSDCHLSSLDIDQHMMDLSAISDIVIDCVRVWSSSAPNNNNWWSQIFKDFKRLNLCLGFYHVDDPTFLTELPQLVSLVPPNRLCDELKLKYGERKTPAEVKTFQRSICKALGIETPEFLKPRRVVRTKASGEGLHLADLKVDLLSGEPDKVLAALERVKKEGSPVLYEEILTGVDTDNLYDSDSKAIGDFFKRVKAGERPLARWAVTTLLSIAPDDAVQACLIRDSIQKVALVEGFSMDDLPLPSLKSFKRLEKLTIVGFSIKDLSCITGNASVKSITLQNLLHLESLNGLAELPSLEQIHFKECPVLSSLEGVSATPSLTSMYVENCESVKQFTFLRHLPHLTDFNCRWRGRRGSPGLWGGYDGDGIDLSEFGVFSNIDFLSGLKSAPAISLNLQGSVDLSVFNHLETIKVVNLDVDTLQLDLSPLRHVEQLQLNLIFDPYGARKRDLGEEIRNDSERWRHDWSYDLPNLRSLRIDTNSATVTGLHDFSSMNAPSLDEVFLSDADITSFKGVGHAREIRIDPKHYSSLEGLENSPIEDFSISGTLEEGDLTDLSLMSKLPHLKTLKIPSILSAAHQKQLTGCAQIKRLEATYYKGDLSFLKGWDSLDELDLRDSGMLEGIDAVEALPNLKRIRLRGSKMKRDSWPKSLQDILDYMGT